MKTLFTTLLAMGVLAFGTTAANAAYISFYIDQSNEADMTQGVNYAQVIISDSTTTVGDIDFDVIVNTALFDTTYTDLDGRNNFGMQNFSFNYDTTSAASGIVAANIVNIDPATWTISQDANAGGDWGKFEFQLDGTGSTRTEHFQFSITGIDGDVLDDYATGSLLNPSSGEYFAAHIADFGGYENFSSAQFAGSTPGGTDRNLVPIPAAAWLFGSGLIGLVGVARRKETTC